MPPVPSRYSVAGVNGAKVGNPGPEACHVSRNRGAVGVIARTGKLVRAIGHRAVRLAMAEFLCIELHRSAPSRLAAAARIASSK